MLVRLCLLLLGLLLGLAKRQGTRGWQHPWVGVRASSTVAEWTGEQLLCSVCRQGFTSAYVQQGWLGLASMYIVALAAVGSSN